ncbi:hypothetical protein AB0M20_02075 [Actinoplanes sp. NPDC051633]|uniref:hypothetical protein n=1 Tax=Actinoplanes sp. NPDC051633 TaxID=3155670 RepID=UPI00343E26B8
MTDNAQEVPQPVYFLCDVSVHMGQGRLLLANLLMGHLASEISEDPLLTLAVRWGVHLYGATEGADAPLPIQQVDFTDVLPELHPTIEEPAFAVGAAALRKRMGVDISQLDADYAEVRSPFIVVLSSGVFAEAEADLDRAFRELLEEKPPFAQDREWSPTIMLVSLRAADPAPVEHLMRHHENVDLYDVATEADVTRAADELVRVIRRTVVTGERNLKYARWVTAEKDLVLGGLLTRTPVLEVSEVDDHPLSNVTERLRYRKFLDAGQNAEAHPFDALLSMVSLRGAPPPPGRRERMIDRAVWPHRLVVADDPGAAAGVLVPPLPSTFTHNGDGVRPRWAGDLLPGESASTTDRIARLRVCAEIADIIDLAHGYHVLLGERTCESAVFRIGPLGPDVLLSDCDDARPFDPADPDPAARDLIWLGQFVESCAADRPGDAGAEQPVFDDSGRDLLRLTKSNVSRLLPAAATWRDYLTRRAIELQGPPVLEDVLVTPRFAPVGEQVKVLWRTRYADSLTLIGADGRRLAVPPQHVGDSNVQFTVTMPGPIALHLRNQVGERRATTDYVHVYELPTLTELPVPAPPPEPVSTALAEAGDLLTGAWALDGAHLREALTVSESVDKDLVDTVVAGPRQTRRARPLQIFPYDVGKWFTQRPRPRNRWRWLPWAS